MVAHSMGFRKKPHRIMKFVFGKPMKIFSKTAPNRGALVVHPYHGF